MKLIVYAFRLMIGLSVFASPDCGVSESDWASFSNYVAWCKIWREQSYMDAHHSQVDYVKHQDQVFWFLPGAKLLISYFPKNRGSAIGSGTCPQDPWTKCIKLRIPSREQPAIADLLIGRFPKEKETETVISEPCHRKLNRSDIAAWRPSPDSILKRTLLSKIGAEVRGHASFGSLKSATVNDFNVLDPEVFVVAEVEHPRSEKRLLMFIEINSAGDAFATLWRAEEESDACSLIDNTWLIEKVLQNGIKIQ